MPTAIWHWVNEQRQPPRARSLKPLAVCKVHLM